MREFSLTRLLYQHDVHYNFKLATNFIRLVAYFHSVIMKETQRKNQGVDIFTSDIAIGKALWFYECFYSLQSYTVVFLLYVTSCATFFKIKKLELAHYIFEEMSFCGYSGDETGK